LSNIIVRGNLTRDAEAVATTGEKCLVKFSVADTRSKKDAAGAWVDDPHFIDCAYWTKDVQGVMKQLTKGAPVMIFGDWKQERWEKDGVKSSKISVTINSFRDITIGARREATPAAGGMPENPPAAGGIAENPPEDW